MTGPSTVSGSSGSPTFSVRRHAGEPAHQLVVDAALRDRAAWARCRSGRSGSAHTLAMLAIAVLRSASSNTMPRPCRRAPAAGASCLGPRPRRCACRQRCEPVKLTMSTCGDVDERLGRPRALDRRRRSRRRAGSRPRRTPRTMRDDGQRVLRRPASPRRCCPWPAPGRACRPCW